MNFSRATISVIVFGLALWAGFKLGERIDLIESLVRISLEARADAEIPDSKHDQFNLLIIGLTDETRRRNKESLLKIDRREILTTAERYFSRDQTGKAVAVISSRDLIEAANTKMTGKALSVHAI